MLHLTIREIDDASFRQHDLLLVHEWRDVAGSVCAHGYVGEGVSWIRWPGFVTFRFAEDRLVEAWPERLTDPDRIRDLFYRTVEPLILQALGWETLHASAVLMPAGVVAFCGDCESGKSTIAYGLSRRGHLQHADDSVVVQPASDGVRALNLPFGVRLRPASAAFLGFTSGDRVFQDVVPIARPTATTVSTSVLDSVFVLSRIADGEPRARRFTPSEAFTALLPHARCFNAEDAASRRRLLNHYLEIVAAVPVYDLRFPSGLNHLATVLDSIERTVGVAQAEAV
jgi:hypothetical protein